MSSTSSTAHRRDFCRALYLQPSPEKLGRAALNVHIPLVSSETITNYSLLITNCIFAPSDKKLGRGAWGVFFETTETTGTKETTAKQSIIRMIINFSVISVVPYCLCCLFSQKRRSLLTITNYSLLITNCIFAPSDKKLISHDKADIYCR